MIKAVISGDIVASTSLTNAGRELIENALKELIDELRACCEITTPFMLVLLLANFVKKPRRSSAMPAFFASLPNKITSPNSENLFRNKP